DSSTVSSYPAKTEVPSMAGAWSAPSAAQDAAVHPPMGGKSAPSISVRLLLGMIATFSCESERVCTAIGAAGERVGTNSWEETRPLAPAAFTATRRRDDLSASKRSADLPFRLKVSPEPRSARRSGSPLPLFRQLRTLREHPSRS